MSSRNFQLARAFVYSFDGANSRLYKIFATKIVGCQYHNGVAFANENIFLIRNAGNLHDNAIRAYDSRGVLMGYLPRDIAAQLAPFMDSGDIEIRAVSGEQGNYDCPVYLMIHEKRRVF